MKLKNGMAGAVGGILGGSLLLLAGTERVQAQDTEELLTFSRHNFGLSSARSAGMGGAFTSLGADALSLSLNPAGVAMYTAGEASVTGGLKVGATSTDYRGFNYFNGRNENIGRNQNATKGNVSSMSLVYAKQVDGSNNSFSLAFGMNRLADFNRRSRAVGFSEEWSIADMFAAQLSDRGFASGTLGSQNGDIYKAFYGRPPGSWGSIMAYQTGLVDPWDFNDPNNTKYTTFDILGDGVMIDPGRNRKTEGAINEYAITGGFNLDDIFYVGMSVGIQDIYYDRYDTYTEVTYMPDGSQNIGLDNLTYRQNLRLGGTGVNLKVGATVRPVSWLRIGMAYHSPTWINMDEEYEESLTVYDWRDLSGGSYLPVYSDTPYYVQDYNMRTPSRFNAGISAMLGTIGMISVDYERAWYNKMKYTTNGFEDLNGDIKEFYKPGNTVRVGLEMQPFRSFFLRGGYGFSSSPYKNSGSIGEYQQYSAGMGYRNRLFNVDLAYVYGTTKQLPTKLFSDWVGHDPVTAQEEPVYLLEPSGTVYTKERNHHVLLSVGVRF